MHFLGDVKRSGQYLIYILKADGLIVAEQVRRFGESLDATNPTRLFSLPEPSGSDSSLS
jgi:hypothetical protein